MKTPVTRKRLLCIAILLLATAQAASAQNIYKCMKAGQVEYTDHACHGGNGELIHQASDGEILDQYLDLGQDALAKRYADSHHLQALYKERLDLHQQKMEAMAQQLADDEKQRDEDARQQELIAEAAYNGRLQGENDALRQQNDQYLDQTDQPDYDGYAPVYWGGIPPYWGHGRNHGRGHGSHNPPPRPAPRAAPRTASVGGRLK